MKILGAIILITFAALGAACGASEPTPPPSPTIEAITFSTPTAVPSPTPSPVRAVSTLPPVTPGSIASVMTRTKDAPRYRVTLTLNVRTGVTTPFALDLKGEAAGDDEHYDYTLGSERIEFIFARGQYFAKGARSLGLPNATKWYVLPTDLGDTARPPFSIEDLLTSFVALAPKENFANTGRQPLDGTSCQVYRYVPKNLNETGIANILSDAEAPVFGALDASEIRLWICDDAFLHQLTIDVSGHNPRRTADKGTVKLQVHLWDFANTAIKIEPPANPEKFSPSP